MANLARPTSAANSNRRRMSSECWRGSVPGNTSEGGAGNTACGLRGSCFMSGLLILGHMQTMGHDVQIGDNVRKHVLNQAEGSQRIPQTDDTEHFKSIHSRGFPLIK